MFKWLNKLREKNRLYFALLWIVVYIVLNSAAIPLSALIGVESSAALAVNAVLSALLFFWLKSNGLAEHYGLRRVDIPASRFLFYIPLIVFMSRNLWFGFAINFPPAGTVCYILSMLLVGFLEEVIMRGLLFRALAEKNVKTAIIITSVTFGLGHIVNLFNGSGMDLVANICQVFSAVGCGFLFVIIFHRSGSLIPCIVAHSVHNAVSVFGNEAGITAQKRIIFSVVTVILVVGYALILMKTLPKNEYSEPENIEAGEQG
ncbi:MAG: CPBP family intramembrane metalloprotease [Clostridiales bacterium]|nr:CPBP family intramembrane metalloprotease [Clostridiales bacterium]